MRIVLVDDHHEVLNSLAEFMRGLGHEVEPLTDGATALRRIRTQRPDFVLSDVRMPGMDGMALLAALEDTEPPITMALMTAFSDTALAVAAMRHGAVDYLRKPIDVRELHGLLQRVAPIETAPLATVQADGLVVASPAFAAVVTLADRLHAARILPCVIEAETGCGKELIARRIHHGGRDDDRRPFIAINCAAIPDGLFEAEFFGYAPGAFTGASGGGAEGKLALAGEGTVFLDEIAELTLEQQAKLLRVLEDRTWYPLGGTRQQTLRARVVCATNRPLADLVALGRFREDLLYRLKVGYLRIPPLRERSTEIPVLARTLLPSIRSRLGRGFSSIEPAAMALLSRQSWPGNVRQLQHTLELAAVAIDGEALGEKDLRSLLADGPLAPTAAVIVPPGGLALPACPPADLTLSGDSFDLDAWQRGVIVAALARHDGSPVRTAAYLRISRKVLYTLRRRYGLLTPETAHDE